MRLIGFNESTSVKDSVLQCILSNYQSEQPEIRDYYGAHEFKLQGYPFHCAAGCDIIKTRILIAKVLVSIKCTSLTKIQMLTLVSLEISQCSRGISYFNQ